MKQLRKELETRRLALIDDMTEAMTKVTQAVNTFNETMAAQAAIVEAAVNGYNELIDQATELKEEAQQDVRDYFDKKSEKWQEGERGQQYQSWIDSFDGISLPDLEVMLPEEVDEPDGEACGELENEWPYQFPG